MSAFDSWVFMSLGDNKNKWLVKASDKFCILTLRMKEHIKFVKGSQVKQLYQLGKDSWDLKEIDFLESTQLARIFIDSGGFE